MHNENAIAMAAPKFKGRIVELGDVTYVVPSLALGALKEGLLDRIRAPRAPGEMPPIALVFEVVLAALQRNYPGLTMQTLDELDAGELTGLYEAFVVVVELSGFKPKKLESAEGNGAPGKS